MATVTVRPRAQSGGGHRGPINTHYYGGGDGGHNRRDDSGDRLRRYRLGIALALACVMVLFLALSAAFLLRHSTGTWDTSRGRYVQHWDTVILPFRLLLFNTIVLLLSSVAVEKARRQAMEFALLSPLRDIPGISLPRSSPSWIAISGLLGMLFLMGQAAAWRHLSWQGDSVGSIPSRSFFYILTGAHALHLVGGLIALFYAAVLSKLFSRTASARRIAVDVTAWYWHGMAALWLFILTVLLLGR